MAAAMHQEMHQDHLAWKSGNDLWRDQLRTWEYDAFKAKETVPRVLKEIENHEQALAQHAAAIRLYEQQVLEHEHAICSQEEGGGDAPTAMAAAHGEEAARHREQSERYQTLKTRHHEIMKHWHALLKALHVAHE
jgi:hypothetical protein